VRTGNASTLRRVMDSRLSEAWDAAAEDWIRWARSKPHDHFYWRLARPHLLGLIPPLAA